MRTRRNQYPIRSRDRGDEEAPETKTAMEESTGTWNVLKTFLGNWGGRLETTGDSLMEPIKEIENVKQPALVETLASNIYKIWKGGDKKAVVEENPPPMIVSIPVKQSPSALPLGVLPEPERHDHLDNYVSTQPMADSNMETPEQAPKTRSIGVGPTPVAFHSIGVGRTPVEHSDAGVGRTPVVAHSIAVGQTPAKHCSIGVGKTPVQTESAGVGQTPVATGSERVCQASPGAGSIDDEMAPIEAVGDGIENETTMVDKGVRGDPPCPLQQQQVNACEHCGIPKEKGVFCCSVLFPGSPMRTGGDIASEQSSRGRQGIEVLPRKGQRFSDKWHVPQKTSAVCGAKRLREEIGGVQPFAQVQGNEKMEKLPLKNSKVVSGNNPPAPEAEALVSETVKTAPSDCTSGMRAEDTSESLQLPLVSKVQTDSEGRSPKRVRLEESQTETSPPRLVPQATTRNRKDSDVVSKGSHPGGDIGKEDQPNEVDFSFPVQELCDVPPKMLKQQESMVNQGKSAQLITSAVSTALPSKAQLSVHTESLLQKMPPTVPHSDAAGPSEGSENPVLNLDPVLDGRLQTSDALGDNPFHSFGRKAMDTLGSGGEQVSKLSQGAEKRQVTSLEQMKANARENHSIFQASWGTLMTNVGQRTASKNVASFPVEDSSGLDELVTKPQLELNEADTLLREASLKHFSLGSAQPQKNTERDAMEGESTHNHPPSSTFSPLLPPALEESIQTTKENQLSKDPDDPPSPTVLEADPYQVPLPPKNLPDGHSMRDRLALDNTARVQSLGLPCEEESSANQDTFAFVAGSKGIAEDVKKEPSKGNLGPIRSFLPSDKPKTSRVLGQRIGKVKALEQAKKAKQRHEDQQRDRAEKKKKRHEDLRHVQPVIIKKETGIKRLGEVKLAASVKKTKCAKDQGPDPKKMPFTPKYKLTQNVPSQGKKEENKGAVAGGRVSPSSLCRTPQMGKQSHVTLKKSAECTPQYELTPPSVTARHPNEEDKAYRANKTVPSWAKAEMKSMDQVMRKLNDTKAQDVFGHIPVEVLDMDMLEVFGEPDENRKVRWRSRMPADWSDWKG